MRFVRICLLAIRKSKPKSALFILIVTIVSILNTAECIAESIHVAVASNFSEAIEAIAHGDKVTSKVVGRPLAEVDLPEGATIGAIVRNDEVIKSAMPGEMYKVYEHYKRDEWEKYNATVTDWDLDMYLDCLP